MTENQAKNSFGQYLNSRRVEAGLDLDYISGETKIGKRTLEAIEEEDHAQLPEPVYVKGFIRSFARTVGADGDWAVSDYARSQSEYFETRQSESDFAIGKGSFWPRFLLGAALVVALAIATYFAYLYYKKNFGVNAAAERSTMVRHDTHKGETGRQAESVENENAKRTEIASAAESEKNPAAAGDTDPTANSAEKKNSKYELEIEATDATWIKIIADGRQADEYQLMPGEKTVVKADERYNILVGNAGGVKFNLNGKPVHVPGKSGQMVNIELP